MARRAAGVALVVALAALLCGCTLQTMGGVKGNRTLTAEFDDVDQLAVGHSVQMADVVVGSVTGIRLDRYKALVTLSLEDGVNLPVGTTAVLKKTSLLGENYVELDPPSHAGPPYLRSGARITDVRRAPDLEAVTEQAIQVFGAMAGRDVGAIVQAGAQSFGEHASDVRALLADMRTFGSALDSQSGQLAALTDDFARITGPLASADGDVRRGITGINVASAAMAANRQRMLAAARQLTQLAAAFNDTFFGPGTDNTIRMVTDMSELLSLIAAHRDLLDKLIVNNHDFTVKIPNAIRHGAAQQFSVIQGSSPPSASPTSLQELLGPR